MNPLFRAIASCPACGGQVTWIDDPNSPHGRCQACGHRYPVIDGVPRMRLDAGVEADGQSSPGWRARISRAAQVPAFAYKTARSRGRIPHFVAALGPEAILLNVGSGSTSFGPRVVNLDIAAYPHVDVVAGGERLPVQDASLDAVITQGVLEHVPDLPATLAEIDRVLRPGGEVYHEVPFIQGYHGSPGDFRRFTLDGLRELAPGYEILDRGVAVGPSSAAGWLLSEWLALLFSLGSRRLHKLGRRLFGWLLSPLKLADRWLEGRPEAWLTACAFYLVARKPATDRDG